MVITNPESRLYGGPGAISDDATVFLDVGLVKIEKTDTGAAWGCS